MNPVSLATGFFAVSDEIHIFKMQRGGQIAVYRTVALARERPASL